MAFLRFIVPENSSMNPSRHNDRHAAPNPALTGDPRLATSLPHRGGHLRSHEHQRTHPTAGARPPLSASIPLPASHIRRTPSELQLAADVRRAEVEDGQMYARLAAGMRSQCLAAGRVHPLTWRSLRDLQRTQQADGDWELSHCAEEEDGASADAPRLVRTPSEGSLISHLSGGGREGPEDDDEGVFSLEL